MSPAKRFLSPSQRTKVSQADEKANGDLFVSLCARVGLPVPVREYKFAKREMRREWKFDFAWRGRAEVDDMIALEVEGGVWTQGRHSRGAGMLADMEKYNAAALLGWKVFRTTPDKLCDLATLRLLGKALGVTVGEIGAIR